MVILNKKLKAKRELSNLTQEDISNKAAISTRTYQNYELGLRSPKVEIAIKIAEILDSTVEELFRS